MDITLAVNLALARTPKLVWQSLMQGRKIYHAAPLHYLPSILCMRALFCARRGRSLGIAPRQTAERRDRMLDLDRYVHCSFDLVTPLLRDKLARGMPHVLLEFDVGLVIASGAPHALLRFNAKAWRSHQAIQPVIDWLEMTRLVKQRDEFGRFQSLEFLIESDLSLQHMCSITTFSDRDAQLVHDLLAGLDMDFVLRKSKSALIYSENGRSACDMRTFVRECIGAQTALSIPKGIVFD